MFFSIGEQAGDRGRAGADRLFKPVVIVAPHRRTQRRCPAAGLLNIDNFQWQITGIAEHLHPNSGMCRATGKADTVDGVIQRQNLVLMQKM